MKIPSCYIEEGDYAQARLLNPTMADNYVAHTFIGDPLADAAIESVAHLGQKVSSGLIRAGMRQDYDALENAPSPFREFFHSLETPPEWVNQTDFGPGIRMFHRNSRLVLGAMVGGTLVEGFTTNISKSFFITGRLRDQGVRRLRQNNRHMVEIFIPGGLDREGDGWKLSVRIRLIHAMVRRLLSGSEDWDTESWGTPICAAHVGYAITAFSARLLQHLKSLGADFDDEERASFMQVWRYSGHLMGIPESILFKDEKDALEQFRIGEICEPPPGMESIVLAHSLINSAPLIAGITDAKARADLSKYVFRVSRALIGANTANSLKFPRFPTFGVLPWFRLQDRYNRMIDRLFPGRLQRKNPLLTLFNVSMFDEEGISFRLPDHVYAEKSSWW